MTRTIYPIVEYCGYIITTGKSRRDAQSYRAIITDGPRIVATIDCRCPAPSYMVDLAQGWIDMVFGPSIRAALVPVALLMAWSWQMRALKDTRADEQRATEIARIQKADHERLMLARLRANAHTAAQVDRRYDPRPASDRLTYRG